MKAAEASDLHQLRDFLRGIVSGGQELCEDAREEEQEDCVDVDDQEGETEASEFEAPARARVRKDNAQVLLDMIATLLRTRPQANLRDVEARIGRFREGSDAEAGEDATPGAAVVRLMTIHKAKGLGFHRVYLLQPGSGGDMLLKTIMLYGEPWEQQAEINASFVAQTRSYADLIFLQHLEPCSAGRLDFSLLWPLGLKWETAGSQRPPTGTEITNEALASALEGGKVEFTKQEWDGFDVSHETCYDSYIKAGQDYYRPARDQTSTQGTAHDRHAEQMLKEAGKIHKAFEVFNLKVPGREEIHSVMLFGASTARRRCNSTPTER